MSLNDVKPIALAALVGIAVAGCDRADRHDDHSADAGHADHDDEAHEDGADHDNGNDDHADEGDHDEHEAGDEHDGHEDGDEEHVDVVTLTPEQLERAGVRIAPLAGGTIATHLTLPAEVGLNQDRVVHVTPRVSGVAFEVHGLLGHDVSPGDLLAVLESPELGEAKLNYLERVQAASLAESAFDLERTISASTGELLDLLREDPSLDDVRDEAARLRAGENKGRLLSAYAKMRAAESNYARERELRTQNLATEADLILAQEAFGTSQANYVATFEDIDFSHRLQLQEAERDMRVARSSARNAARRLHLLGLTSEQIEGIETEPEERIARYELRAAAAGRIVSKHITSGEKVGTEAPIYTIADLETVWLNISVYAQYAEQIETGQEVLVHAGDRRTTGVVDYVSALMTEGTRTVSARVVLDNAGRSWTPGEFVTVRIEVDQREAARVVPVDAVQTYEGRRVVFVQDEDGIEPVAVREGRQDGRNVELLGEEIALETPIVVANSFLMKAELGKSAAGHEH
jgi:cobalt-zinc-cadmium efflux system membrane fusion protein